MNSNHSHGQDPRGHGSPGHGQHAHEKQAHHRPHPHPAHHRHESRARRGVRFWFTRAGRACFCKRGGRVSALKLTALVFACLASIYVVLISGLMPFDVAGPIVKRALEAKLGEGTRVRIGKTSLGQNSSGQPVLSVSNVVIKSRHGATIATAPRAEIVLDSGMLVGNFRAKRIDLLDAIMTLRIDEHGRIGITADEKPSAAPPAAADNIVPRAGKAPELGKATGAPASVPFMYPEIAAWLDRLERSGLDGIALSEVGLKHGTLVSKARSNSGGGFLPIQISSSRVRRKAASRFR